MSTARDGDTIARMTAPRSPLVRADERASLAEHAFSHPLNPKSELRSVALGDLVGLKRLGVHLVRMAPGKESFVRHSHYLEEEFIYVLSGRGVVELDDEEHEVGPGDFLGFPTPSVAHHLRNPFAEELVYLTAGERRDADIAEYPTLGKRVVRIGTHVAVHALGSDEGFPGQPLLGEKRK